MLLLFRSHEKNLPESSRGQLPETRLNQIREHMEKRLTEMNSDHAGKVAKSTEVPTVKEAFAKVLGDVGIGQLHHRAVCELERVDIDGVGLAMLGKFRADDAIVIELAKEFPGSHLPYQLDPAPPPPKLPPPPLKPLNPPPEELLDELPPPLDQPPINGPPIPE